MNMIEKKDPRQESVKFDSSEDDVIIDLTDEITVESENDNDTVDLSSETDDDPPIIAKGDKAGEDKEDDEFEEMTGAMDHKALDEDEDDPHDMTGVFDLDDFDDDDPEEDAQAVDPTALDEDEDDPHDMTGVFNLDDFDDDSEEDSEAMDLTALDEDDDPHDMTGVFDLEDLGDLEDDKDEMTMVTDLDDFDDDKDEMTMATDLDDFDDDKDEMTMATDLDDFDDDKDEMTMVTDLDDFDDDKDEMTMATDLDDFDDDKDEMTMVTDLDDFDDDKDEMTMVTDLDDFDDDKDEMTMVADLDDLDDEKEEMTMVTDLDDLDDEKDEMTMITDLDAFDDDPEEMTQVRDLADFDDDTIIVDNGPDQAEENNSAAVASPSGETGWNDDLFDPEENTDTEYGLDDEDNELIELDEERGEADHDFADMMLAVSTETNEGEAARAPEKYLDFENDDRDDVIDLESDQDQKAEFVSLDEDGTPEFINRNGLPEIETLSDLDFDEDNADQETEEPKAAGSDDIIAKAVAKSLSLDDEYREVDRAREAESEREKDEALLDLGGSAEMDDRSASPAAEDHPKSEFVDNLLHLEEQAEIEDVDEVIALDNYGGLKDNDGEEIIEITEFDQHFSADEEITLNQTGMVNPSKADDEDDFLELIDVEEDSPFEEKGLIEFSDSPPDTGEAEINPVLGDEIDPDSISRQIDPINQISPQDGTVEIEIALSPIDQVAEGGKKDDTVLEELKVGQAIDELSTTPSGDINAAVEQILNEKFADKIEAIIYDVIEKAVAKEIDRLKRALLGNDTIDNFEP